MPWTSIPAISVISAKLPPPPAGPVLRDKDAAQLARQSGGAGVEELLHLPRATSLVSGAAQDDGCGFREKGFVCLVNRHGHGFDVGNPEAALANEFGHFANVACFRMINDRHFHRSTFSLIDGSTSGWIIQLPERCGRIDYQMRAAPD